MVFNGFRSGFFVWRSAQITPNARLTNHFLIYRVIIFSISSHSHSIRFRFIFLFISTWYIVLDVTLYTLWNERNSFFSPSNLCCLDISFVVKSCAEIDESELQLVSCCDGLNGTNERSGKGERESERIKKIDRKWDNNYDNCLKRFNYISWPRNVNVNWLWAKKKRIANEMVHICDPFVLVDWIISVGAFSLHSWANSFSICANIKLWIVLLASWYIVSCLFPHSAF